MTTENYLVFKVRAQSYAIPVRLVQEIRRIDQLTPLPEREGDVLGVINLRGTVVPVIDVRVMLATDDAHTAAPDLLVILHINERVLGVLVDGVEDVSAIDPQTMQPAPELAGHTRSKLIEGFVQLGERLVLVIDMPALLASRRHPVANSQ